MVKNEAIAYMFGGPLAPQLSGTVKFIPVDEGTLVQADIKGLPDFKPGTDNSPQIGPYGFHIHDVGSCTIGNSSNPFMTAGGHYNPGNQPHGNHAGDFPVLFSNNGAAKMSFISSKFTVNDIIGKSVIIHQSPDDYRSQPAGNSGKRLACGVIMRVIESAKSYK